MPLSKTPTPEPPISPRGRCHHAIRHAFSGAIAGYVRKHPELLEDEKTLDAATYAMVKLMDHVLAIVDEYAIEDREPSR